jgi:hypothetical protein
LIDVSQKELGYLNTERPRNQSLEIPFPISFFIFSWALPVAKNEGCFLLQRNIGRERQMVLKKRKNKTERETARGRNVRGRNNTLPFW